MKVYNVIQIKNGLVFVSTHVSAQAASNRLIFIADNREPGEQIQVRIEETELEE